MAEKMTLGGFVKRLVAILHQKGVSIPLGHERPWHELIYGLYRIETAEGKPEFFTKLRFNWDDPYPVCPELSEFLQGLRFNLDIVRHSDNFYAVLSKELEDLWFGFHKIDDEKTKEFFKYAVELAEKKFLPYAPQVR